VALLFEACDLPLKPFSRDATHDVAEHLHQAPIRIPGEARVAGAPGQAGDRLIVQAQVQNRVEHPRHRVLCARTHRDEQRVPRIAEALADSRLEAGERLVNLIREPGGSCPALAHVLHASCSGDREPRGDQFGTQDAGHLSDARALATEQLAQFLRAFAEVIDPFSR
jgi:hypothetical protein